MAERERCVRKEQRIAEDIQHQGIAEDVARRNLWRGIVLCVPIIIGVVGEGVFGYGGAAAANKKGVADQ